MTELIFHNKQLQEILALSDTVKTFTATFSQAVNAYEKDTGKRYRYGDDLDRYYEIKVPTLWLVKDSGIYLMTPAKLEKIPEDGSHVCYAEGFEPDAPDSWERCRAAVGGDDFAESFPITDELRRGIKNGANIHIQMTAESFTIVLVYRK